jgi:hypothetical protein
MMGRSADAHVRAVARVIPARSADALATLGDAPDLLAISLETGVRAKGTLDNES